MFSKNAKRLACAITLLARLSPASATHSLTLNMGSGSGLMARRTNQQRRANHRSV